jgi:hypothetical protein
MTWQDFINKLYNDYYLKDESKTKDIWVTNPQLHKFVRNTFIKKIFFNPDDKDESALHFKFLEYIMYNICDYIENNDYLIFIGSILISILEDANGISKEHNIWETIKLYKLVKLPELLYYFRDPDDDIIKLSNGRVKAFIEAILDKKINKTICVQMKQIINSRPSRTTYSATRNFGKGYNKKTKPKKTKPKKTKPRKTKTKPRKTKPKPRKTKKNKLKIN